MDMGNKGDWMSHRKFLILALTFFAATIATPLKAQLLSGATLTVGASSEWAVYDPAGNYSYATSLPDNGVLRLGPLTTSGTGTVVLSGNTTTADGLVLTAGTFASGGCTGVGTIRITSNNILYTGTTTVSGGMITFGATQPISEGGTITFNFDPLPINPDPQSYFDYLNAELAYRGKIVLSGAHATQDTISTEETTVTESPSLLPLTVALVPEPSTIGLLLVAALGAVMASIRRKVE